jgi:hypothetical protein
MTTFHKGQDVEVSQLADFSVPAGKRTWRKAKIVTHDWQPGHGKSRVYQVQFSDNSRAVFDAEHIRDAEPGLDQEIAAAKWAAGAIEP